MSRPSPGRGVRYVDAHNHLQDEWLQPHLEAACAQLAGLPLSRAVVNGTCEEDWPRVADLAARFSWIQPSYGVHPWLAGGRSPGWRDALLDRLDRDPSAALGEIGIDRWILDRARPDDPRLAGLRRAPLEEQLDVFREQLQIAAERDLPVSIHCLDAWGALDEAVARGPLPARGFLLHAYGGSLELMHRFAARGAYFSFSGSFLGDQKARQQAVFREVPLDRLLVETDAPSMPLPPAWRTHKLPPGPGGMALNHPANIEAVYTGLAALRGLPLDELSAAVEENVRRLFGERKGYPAP